VIASAFEIVTGKEDCPPAGTDIQAKDESKDESKDKAEDKAKNEI